MGGLGVDDVGGFVVGIIGFRFYKNMVGWKVEVKKVGGYIVKVIKL